MTDFEVRPAAGHARMRWANGGGWTTEIVAEPSSAQWSWRLSVADVAVDGPFSAFPGVDRTIALLRGAGFALTVCGRDEQIIDSAFRPFEFSGDETTTCRLIDGPVQDLNLMTTRQSGPRRLEFVHIAAGATEALGDIDVALVVAGEVRIEGQRLGYLDAIRCASPSTTLSLTAANDGAVVATVAATQAPSRSEHEAVTTGNHG
ncbi:MAG: HutD/Ves family protein [Ilumatobacteraceae bacterium]